MNATTHRLDAQIELGFLFGMVHASFVGEGYGLYGAHVEIDGNVIYDTTVRSCFHPTDDEILVIRALRKIAEMAWRGAMNEIGVSINAASVREFRRAISLALPFPLEW